MSDPRHVLVIHGVGNRGEESGFTSRVETLNDAAGDHLNLIPVYWGDLAADPTHFGATLPDVGAPAVRGAGGEGGIDPIHRALGLSLLQPDDVTRGDDALALVQDEAAARSAPAVRSGDDVTIDEAELRAAIADAWKDLQWLPQVGEPAVLRSTGAAVSKAAAEAVVAEPASDEFATRGDDVRSLGSNLRNVVKAVMEGIDDVVGDVVGEIGGRLNHGLRASFGGGFINFFGDILAYLGNRDGIQQRVRDVIAEHAPGAGTEQDPVHAIAHSLGGGILFDFAVDEQPLYLDTFVTFGSQSSFFHAISRRSPVIEAYDGTHPVRLPATIKRWSNLWDPLDFVAFLAASMFELSDGSMPKDVEVEYDLDSGLWTHSVYWKRPELLTVLRDTMPAS